jgi:predicted TIM-barrel fold metal-dependent hydrolase
MVFDCHVHGPAENGTFWQWHPVTRDAGDMVRYLRDCGVTRAVVSCAGSQRSRTAADLVIGNDIACRLSEEHPGFVTPACLVNPNFLPESLAELERAAARGVRWVGELCGYIAGYPFTAPSGEATAGFAEIVRRASGLGMVLHLHAGTEEMARLAEAYPQARFVIAHIGDSAPRCAERIEMVASHPNVHLDISGAGSERVGILELAVQRIGPERVLFGSDFTINDPGMVIARVQRASLSAAEREKVLHENVERLLSLAAGG